MSPCPAKRRLAAARTRWGSLQRTEDPLAGVKGPISKWRGGDGKRGRYRGEGGREEGEGRKEGGGEGTYEP